MDSDFKSIFSSTSTPVFPPCFSTNPDYGNTPLHNSLFPLPCDFSLSSSSFDFPPPPPPPPPSFSLFSDKFTFFNTQLVHNSPSQLFPPETHLFKIPKKETYHPHYYSSPPPPTTELFLSDHSLNDSLFSFNSSNPPQTLNSVLDGFNIINVNNPSNPSSSSSHQNNNNSNKYSKRSADRQLKRQKLSDKFRSLQKLMPCDKRMDTATLLGEAYNYIKFLQAQVKVLQAMPFHDSVANTITTTSSSSNNDVFGALGLLSRQQLLEVLLNTREAQTRLYSQKCCVYSTEQMLAFSKVADDQKRRRAAALHHQLFMFN